jgi:ethanolamine-phosphate cytidylyltransferase
VDGKDVYATVKSLGKYRSISRTEGVSTTDIVGRMLLCNSKTLAGRPSSRFMKTSSILAKFRGSMGEVPEDAKIVYIDGDFDMFHSGHADVLKRAKAMGDYLVVGVHSDEVVSEHTKLRGNFPILDLHERGLSVTGCTFVDNVVFDAPFILEENHLMALKVSVVIKLSSPEDRKRQKGRKTKDRFHVPRTMGLLKELKIGKQLSALDMVERIHDNRERFVKKFVAKKKKEDAYYAERYGKSAKSGSSKAKNGSTVTRRVTRSSSRR